MTAFAATALVGQPIPVKANSSGEQYTYAHCLGYFAGDEWGTVISNVFESDESEEAIKGAFRATVERQFAAFKISGCYVTRSYDESYIYELKAKDMDRSKKGVRSITFSY